MKDIEYIRNVINEYPEVFFDESIKQDLLNILCENYKDRQYHNLTHITSCLEELNIFLQNQTDEERLIKTEEACLVCAILFHDIIYGDKSEVSDEKLSALAFEYFMSKYVNDQGLIATVKDLILSTEHLREEFKPLYAPKKLIDLIADIDLSILSATPAKYEKYSNSVREEYSYLKDEEFDKGRFKVLKELMNRVEENNLYKTDYFKAKHINAKKNINAELNKLKKNLIHYEENRNLKL